MKHVSHRFIHPCVCDVYVPDVCVSVWAYMQWCRYRGQRATSGVGPQVATCLRQGLLAVPHCVVQASWPVSLQEFSCLHLPSCCRSSGISGLFQCIELDVDSEDLNSDPHAGTGDPLQTKLSIHSIPPVFKLKWLCDEVNGQCSKGIMRKENTVAKFTF